MTSSDELMTDDDFENLLDELEEQKANQMLESDINSSDVTMADDDFERLLDDSGEQKVNQMLERDINSSDVTMADDDFEKLLDELDEQKSTQGLASEQREKHPMVGAGELSNPNDESENDEIAVMLDPSVMIGQASEMHERLCSLLAESATVVLQAGEVNVIDTANMQLLFAFARDRRDKDLLTKIENPSEPFINTANCLGMLDVLAVETVVENLS